ncbi:MAG: prolipoprotein diacylglyceryl transferase family protein, partial [Bacteroidota bacterium]
ENQPTYHAEDVDIDWADAPDTLVNGVTFTPLDIKISFDKDFIKESQVKDVIAPLNNRLLTSSASEINKHYRSFSSNLQINTNTTRDHTEASFRLYGIPRHPAQLYESLSSFLIFLLLLGLYFRRKGETPQGLLFGTFLVLIFTLRFFYEFLKENQVPFEDNLSLNMGQILSIPAILFGIAILVYSLRKDKNKEISAT